jgi:hypothetical protein
MIQIYCQAQIDQLACMASERASTYIVRTFNREWDD